MWSKRRNVLLGTLLMTVLPRIPCASCDEPKPPATTATVDTGWVSVEECESGWRVNHALNHFKPGDVLVQIDDWTTSLLGPLEMLETLESMRFKSTKVVLLRDGQKEERVVAFELDSLPLPEVPHPAYGLGLRISTGAGNGPVVLVGVTPESPAAKAGLRADDIVVDINGVKLEGMDISHLIATISSDKPGSAILTVRRGIDEFEVKLQRVPSQALTSLEKSANKIVQTQTPPDVQAPQFTLITVDRKELSLKSLEGHWVLVNFWASWCKSCVDEIPMVNALAKEVQGRLSIVSIDFDDTSNLQAFLDTQPTLSYPVLLGGSLDSVVGRAYRLSGLPLNVLIDPKQAIYYVSEAVSPAPNWKT